MAPRRSMRRARGLQRSTQARLGGAWADGRAWRSAAGTWQVSGRCVPRRLVQAAFPAAHAMFPAGPIAGPASLLMGGVGVPPGTGPAWPASHPCFVRSLECPGTQSSAPWGDTGAIPLISSLDRFLLHSSLGLGRLPAPAAASPGLSVSVPALAARSRAAGSWGASRGVGVLPAHLQGGPGHASEPVLCKRSSSCLPSPTPFFAGDPLIPRS